MKTQLNEFIKLYDEYSLKQLNELEEFCELHGYTSSEAMTESLNESCKKFDKAMSPIHRRRYKIYKILVLIFPEWLAIKTIRLIK